MGGYRPSMDGVVLGHFSKTQWVTYTYGNGVIALEVMSNVVCLQVCHRFTSAQRYEM